MKDLKETLYESILASDNDLNNREVFDLKIKYKLNNEEQYALEHYKTIDIETIKTVTTKIIIYLGLIGNGFYASIDYVKYEGWGTHKLTDEKLRIKVYNKHKYLFSIYYNASDEFKWIVNDENCNQIIPDNELEKILK